MAWEFEPVAGPYQGPAGGLAWDGEGMLFSLVGEGRIMRYDPGSGAATEFRKYTNRTNGLALSSSGRVYGCQAGSRRMISFDPDGSASLLAERLDGRFHNYPKDLVVDKQGRIWFSDPYSSIPNVGPQLQGPLEHASVLRQEQLRNRDWVIKRMTYDTAAPSGIALSRDESMLFVSENDEAPNGRRELRAYPIRDDGSLGPYRVLHTFGSDHRGPQRGIEGMCLDADGNVVACAGWQQSGPGPMIYVFEPSGRVVETHPFPADLPVNCRFGDADRGTLYVTTSGGQLYRVRSSGLKGS